MPELEQGRPLEDELVAVARLCQAEQQALVRESGQQVVEVLAALASSIEETLAHRGSKVPRTLGTHASASMYGRMTRETRHTRAYSESSSVVQRRCSRQSRRASTATSRPILFLNLKQSATVFATP